MGSKLTELTRRRFKSRGAGKSDNDDVWADRNFGWRNDEDEYGIDNDSDYWRRQGGYSP